MHIHNITITNFKSIYDTQSFDFDDLQGMIKLNGVIGSGKTTLCEALLYGLFGDVKGQNNNQLISWNTKDCTVELNITSKGKEIHIVRGVREPLVIEVDGKSIIASNKRNAQSILEDELYDVPRLAVEKMCLISFASFNSIANMNPSQTKDFVDHIFGFKIFTDYNDRIVIEKKNQQNERVKLQALVDEHTNQIKRLTEKKLEQQKELNSNVDLVKLGKERNEYVELGKSLKEQKNSIVKDRDRVMEELTTLITQYMTLGKQEKQYYNTFKSGVCPTCGHDIDMEKVDESKKKIDEYALKIKSLQKDKEDTGEKYNPRITELDTKMSELRAKILSIDSEIKMYNNNVKLISENYDSLIEESKSKLEETKSALTECENEIVEWNQMTELFTKTLRYSLLDTLIPHINRSIQFFLDKLDQRYKVSFDQEFTAHIFIDTYDEEIAYNNLSTGQRKTLDLAIVFGILQNMISNVDFNIVLLDELFSNMDNESRNLMLSTLKETFEQNKSIFIINHSEMPDDMFSHKISVSLHNKQLDVRGGEKKVVQASRYVKVY